MEEELVDIVNDDDEVTGVTPRKGIHKAIAPKHRAVHIFLIDRNGNIWLEKRGPNCDMWPGHYNSSAGGHVSSGESYGQAAAREAEEELGIPGLRLELKHKLMASGTTANEFVAFYIARSDSRPRLHPDATEQASFSVKEIGKRIKAGEPFTPVFLELFEWYKSNMV